MPYGAALAITGGRTCAPAVAAAHTNTASVRPADRQAQGRCVLSRRINDTGTSWIANRDPLMKPGEPETWRATSLLGRPRRSALWQRWPNRIADTPPRRGLVDRHRAVITADGQPAPVWRPLERLRPVALSLEGAHFHPRVRIPDLHGPVCPCRGQELAIRRIAHGQNGRRVGDHGLDLLASCPIERPRADRLVGTGRGEQQRAAWPELERGHCLRRVRERIQPDAFLRIPDLDR